jgi:hypothetical protein
MIEGLQGTQVHNIQTFNIEGGYSTTLQRFSSTAKVITADAARELQNSHQLSLVFHPSGQGH